MKQYLNYRRLFSISLATLIFSGTSQVMASSINLYDLPKSNGKIVGSVDSNVGIITIFTPKRGGWVKVADPRNGNVGWIKATDFTQTEFSINMISTSKGTHTYQIVQYGKSKSYTPDQAAKIMKQVQVQEQALQKEMQLMMEDMFADIHDPLASFPMIMPVIVVPESTLPIHPKSASLPPAPSSNQKEKK